jgi:hypothetical protein
MPDSQEEIKIWNSVIVPIVKRYDLSFSYKPRSDNQTPTTVDPEAEASVASQLAAERSYVRPADYPFKSEPRGLHSLDDWELKQEIQRRAEEAARYPDLASYKRARDTARKLIEDFLRALDETEGGFRIDQ